jgi:hypothetical protein
MERYKDHDKKVKLSLRNEQTVEYLVQLRAIRSMREKFNAICKYTVKMQKAKRYWNMILGRMDRFIRRRAVRRWLINANLKREK